MRCLCPLSLVPLQLVPCALTEHAPIISTDTDDTDQSDRSNSGDIRDKLNKMVGSPGGALPPRSKRQDSVASSTVDDTDDPTTDSDDDDGSDNAGIFGSPAWEKKAITVGGDQKPARPPSLFGDMGSNPIAPAGAGKTEKGMFDDSDESEDGLFSSNNTSTSAQPAKAEHHSPSPPPPASSQAAPPVCHPSSPTVSCCPSVLHYCVLRHAGMFCSVP